ncbi:MAG TPA: serine hydrolase domain-containing protein [Thermoanaerobaculia bacterium]|nr:serine hydrolase domain-containing protein [Thermoanaerobaculia bacterium]
MLAALADAPTAARATSPVPASTAEPDVRRDIDAVFAAWDHWDTPGAAVVVLRDGEVFYQRGYGSAQLEYAIPITPSTVFHVASVSKQFTCMTIELLARDGKLSWDDEAHRYLPELPDYGAPSPAPGSSGAEGVVDTTPGAPPITLRHLANHTSGIRDQWELLMMGGWRFDDVITREHILRMVFRQRELNFAPGAEHLYSNSGYSLLAEVAARVAGKPFREVAAERIFRPLGMSRTRVHDDLEEIVPGRAYSYAPRDGGGYRNSVLSYSNDGATSLFTTVEDMARWLRNFETGEVGGKAAIESLATRGVLSSGKTIDYALGLANGTYRGARAISHAGSDAGFRSMMIWLPEHRLGVAVLANLASFDAGGAAQSVIDVVIGDRLAPAPAAPGGKVGTAAHPPVELPSTLLDEYVGAYQLDIGALVTIARRDSGLVARDPMGESSALVPLSQTELLMQANGAILTFDRVAGKPSPGFKVRLGGQSFTGKRIEPLPTAGLTDLLGDYWSDELMTGYRLLREGDRLIARHARHPDVELYALAVDTLAGDVWWFTRAAITRDATGRVDGLRLSGNRVRNVRFVRR